MSEPWFRQQALDVLVGALGDELPDEATVDRALVPSAKPEQGDYAFPCFVLARALRRPPPAIAQDLAAAVAERLTPGGPIARVEALGPYCNLFVDSETRARITLSSLLEAEAGFGCSDEGAGRAVTVDFSSPNVAKPFGIGHLRSTVIGNAVCNLYRATGWRPVGINHLGDWGRQFGMLMVSLADREGEASLDTADAPMSELYRQYVAIHAAAKDEPEIEDRAREWFRRLEQGDAEARRLWQRCVDVSLAEFRRTYARLGVGDNLVHWWGESHYEGEPMARVVRELRSSSLLEESEGAQVVFLEDEKLPPCLILKGDGATLYATRDLASAIYRQESTGAVRLVYVVGAAQATHFRQLFSVLRRLGYPWAAECVHVPFGLIQGMSTRRGTMVLLDDVLDEAVRRVRAIVDDREYADEEKARIAEQVGLGAVVFADLANQRTRDWEFDWEQLLNFQGRTGPYLQYTTVRMASILERYGQTVSAEGIDWSALCDAEAADLVRRLATFPQVVARACQEHEPSIVSRFLLDLAESNNRFYNARKVIDPAEPDTTRARALLVHAVRAVLVNGLTLLGVPIPERM